MSWMRDFNWLITKIVYDIYDHIILTYKDIKLSSWKIIINIGETIGSIIKHVTQMYHTIIYYTEKERHWMQIVKKGLNIVLSNISLCHNSH